MTTRPYHIRPGGLLDVPRITDLYMSSFANDQILDIVCPNRHEHPQSLKTYVYRRWVERWWTPNYNLTVLADNATGTVVGFTWWKRPTSELSFYERWISPCRCLSIAPFALMRIKAREMELTKSILRRLVCPNSQGIPLLLRLALPHPSLRRARRQHLLPHYANY